MESKSQGPGLAKVVASGVLLCALLVGAAYIFRDDVDEVADTSVEEPTSATWAPEHAVAASILGPVVARCEEGSNEDLGSGRTKTQCTVKRHPAFMLEVIGKGDEVERVSMMVPMQGDMSQLLDRMLVGLELFSLVAGTQADAFLPKEFLDAIGTSETRAVFQGRLYMTRPVADVGLIFAVLPEPLRSADED